MNEATQVATISPCPQCWNWMRLNFFLFPLLSITLRAFCAENEPGQKQWVLGGCETNKLGGHCGKFGEKLCADCASTACITVVDVIH